MKAVFEPGMLIKAHSLHHAYANPNMANACYVGYVYDEHVICLRKTKPSSRRIFVLTRLGAVWMYLVDTLEIVDVASLESA